MLGLFVFTAAANAQTTLTNLAGEYAILGNLPGDQMGSHVAASANGGWVVWYDNATDGDGSGISGRRLNSSLSGSLGSFRVNQIGAGEQENPQVAVTQDGGAAFVWQGGAIGFQDIYLRIIDGNGVFVGDDILVNSHTAQQQGAPSVATLQNGNLVVVWSSYAQDGSMQGVFARLFSPLGIPLTDEIAVNQQTALNQRNPQVAALADGRFIVVWVSEAVAGSVPSGQASPRHVVEVTGRIFSASGTPLTENDINLSASANVCANPAVVATANGGFIAGWSQLDPGKTTNSWDVLVRGFNSSAQPLGAAAKVNECLLGDQFGIRLAAQPDGVFAVWTSLRQDSSHEGVFGRLVSNEGVPVGAELQVNTTTVSKQMHPSVAAASNSRYVVVWSSFIGGASSFDLFAQRFVVPGGANQLYAPEAPYVTAISGSELSVTWPALAGYPVAFYEIYLDSEASPIVTTTNIHAVIGGLSPGSSHTVQLLFELSDGRRSALSSPSTATTWGADSNGDGIPDEWQVSFWGANPGAWPAANVDSDGDGASNHAEFLAGTNPDDVNSVLKTRLSQSSQGLHFSWGTKPGFVYQVQASDSLGLWENFGVPRFAHGTFDSINLTAGNGSAFYRVIRLR